MAAFVPAWCVCAQIIVIIAGWQMQAGTPCCCSPATHPCGSFNSSSCASIHPSILSRVKNTVHPSPAPLQRGKHGGCSQSPAPSYPCTSPCTLCPPHTMHLRTTLTPLHAIRGRGCHASRQVGRWWTLSSQPLISHPTQVFKRCSQSRTSCMQRHT